MRLNIIHQCGHSHRHQLFGSTRDTETMRAEMTAIACPKCRADASRLIHVKTKWNELATALPSQPAVDAT